jgi:serine/threonine protein phosphatase PrpC
MRTDLASFASGWVSDKGLVREENEDACLVAPHVGLWAVADGMGGHEDGRFASETTIAELSKITAASTAMELRQRCEDAIVSANGLVRDRSVKRGAIVGSTLAALLIFDEHYACIWSGDSRIYRIRGTAVDALTRDHTEVEELLAQGVVTAEEAQRWPRRNVITRAIGVADVPAPEITSGGIAAGDTFLLCSDGLTTHVSDQEMATAAAADGATPQQICDTLLRTTLSRGATDNVTIVVIRVEKPVTTVVKPEPRKVALKGAT